MTAMNTKYARKVRSMMRAGIVTSQKIIGTLIVALGVLSAPPAFAQGTVLPHPLIQWFTNAGAVANGHGLCFFRAGTSTLASTYTTSALSVANANPVLMNSAGRPSSGGIFLVPGESYKVVFKDASVTTCVPDTGVTLFSVDNVQAVPGSSAAVDITGTVGESIAAGEAVFLSNGTGGLTQGQWYKTDSDFTFRSSLAVMVGISPNAITSAASGAIRVSGAVTVAGPLTTGLAYYAGATAGAIVTTPPTNAIRLGQAQSSTSLVVGFIDAPVSPRGPPCGRLTLTTNTPVTVSDVTAATTLYYTPYAGCNRLSLYDGTAWSEYAFAQLSIAVPATTSQMYDVFAYDNAGVLALELTAWTNDTTRATALALQNGVNVKTGALTRLYLGSFRTTGVSGQTEDSLLKRYVWNYYHRVPRALKVTDATANWTYTLATVRQARASTANQVDVVVGVAEVQIDLLLTVTVVNDTAGSPASGIGEDSTTTFTEGGVWSLGTNTQTLNSRLLKFPAIGRHFYSWNESSTASGITTWYGTNTIAGGSTSSGIRGWIEG